MKRFFGVTWPLAILFVAGCSDNLTLVTRDFYNLEHEILDNLVYVCDEDSAKKFNETFKARLKLKEEANKERKEKLERGLISQSDKDNFAKLKVQLEEVDLKSQAASLDARYRRLQNRIRRTIVKMTEDRAEGMKSGDKTFAIESTEVCPNLSSLAIPEKFGGGGGGMGGMMMMGGGGPGGMPAAPGGPPGGPGGAPGGPAAMPGGPGGMPGGPGGMPGMPGMGAGAVAPPKGGIANKDIVFSMTCDRRPDGWNVTRQWKSGNAVVPPTDVDGVDITPLFSQ